MPDSRILLIGRSGQLARELRSALGVLGSVISTSHTAPAGPDSLALDLGDSEAIRRLVRSVRPHLIVNAAAFTDVERAEQEPDRAHQINAIAPGVLAAEAGRLHVAFVHFSTDYVFDGTSKRPYLESDPVAPLNAYGRSKLAGEQAVREATEAHLILRTSWLYASHGRNFLRTMLRLGQERDRVVVVDDQRGSPTSANALATATAAILRNTGGGDRRRFIGCAGTYHLAADGSCSWHEFAERIFAESKLGPNAPEVEAIRSTQFAAKAARPAYSVLDCTKAYDHFGLRMSHWTELLRAVMDDWADGAES